MDAVKHEKPRLRRSLSGTSNSSSVQDATPPSSSSRKEKVWVGVRIRPLLEQELLAKEQTAWRAEQGNNLLFLGQDSLAAQQQTASYQYNRVFPECSTSEQVYADAASSLVAAAVNGYNGTIFAYGQTGSGKTYTMQAIMGCAAREVFALIAQDASREFIIRMAALEIYNETVRDLLQEKSPSVKLLDDPTKGTVADGLSEAGVSSEKQLRQLLDEVAARRQTRATRMNDNSSRSHAIVRLYIESRPLSGAADSNSPHDMQHTAAPLPRARSSVSVTTAAINFVDLAGSERAASSADIGEAEKLRAKEAGNIHKSLLTLSCVIRGLADNQRHLPYRDSKLTRLLQPFLSGNSHMAIVTTISPAAGSADITRAALHFATAAARVVMRPQLNHVASSKAVIKAMASEIQQLKAKLVRLESDTAAMKQKEAEAASATQERDTLRNKLKMLQDQILRGDQATARAAAVNKLRGSVDSHGLMWHNRAALAKELRASSAGILTGRVTSDSAAAQDSSSSKQQQQQQTTSRPGTSGGGSSSSSAMWPIPDLRSSSSELLVGVPDVRRSMRLLNCYLPRNAAADVNSPQQQEQPQQQQTQQVSKQQQSQQQQRQQPGRPSILQPAQAPRQQQQQPQAPSRLQQQGPKQQEAQPEEVVRALQMQKLQEPSGPKAEEAMACLEVEVRCYKHVQEYTLAELSAALEHLESQEAAGQGTGSWSSDQLAALRSEVARKRAAEALTQLGVQALDALSRKVNSYTSSADNSPFVDLRRQLAAACSSDADAGLLEGAAAAARGSSRVCSPEAVLLSQDGHDPGSWPDMAPRLLSGQATPTFRVPGSRGSTIGGAPAAATPTATSGQPAGLTPSSSSSSSVAGSARHSAAGGRPSSAGGVGRPSSAGAGRRLGAGSSSCSSVGASRRTSTTGADASGAAAAAAAVAAAGGALSQGGSGSGAGSGGAAAAAAAAVVAQEKLLQLKEAWRESVEKDVICLREVLGQYKEQLDRLEMQKKLLLSQVLKLEFSLEEEETHAAQLQQQLQQTQQQLQQALRERDTARATAASAVNAAAAAGAAFPPAAAASAAAAAAGVPPLGPCDMGLPAAAAAAAGGPTTPRGGPAGVGALHVALPPINTAAAGIFDACSDDGWASTPTVESLLPKIVALWDELYVPLVYRSRFFLCFRGREVFYYEVEARRLEWKRSQMLQGATEEPSSMGQLARGSYGLDGSSTPTGVRGGVVGGPSGPPRPLSAAAAAGLTASSSSFGGMRRRSKELDKAARALDWERKSLAAGLKWNLTEAEREELYRTWGVDPDTKERKLQLVFKLWSKETLTQPEGMQRSAELVVMLCGMDASEHMMELVFGSHLREYGAGTGPPLARASSSGISYALTNFARRLAPPLSRAAGGIGGSPLRSSMTSIGPSGLSGGAGGGYGGAGGGYAPSRAGGSFTSKLMHSGFMSLLGSKERSNLTSGHLAGMGGGLGGLASREGSFSSLASSVLPGRRH